MKIMKKITTSVFGHGLFILLLGLLSPGSIGAIENSECLDCHSDKSLTKESTDNILKFSITVALYVDEDKFNHSAHNMNGITCVDCHSDIEELNWDNELPHEQNLQKVCCATCHEEVGNAFKNSVHMEILNKGITMTCYACHGYHYVKQMETALLAERENAYCLRCHNPYQYHEWLPAKESHFALVECIICHAPAVPGQIHLTLFDLVSNKLLENSDIIPILGIRYDELMPMLDADRDNILSQKEFDALILMLRQKNVHSRFQVELVAELVADAHEVKRGMAEKTCEKCHAVDSPYFTTVSLLFKKEDGTVDYVEVDRAVLTSYSMSHFYLMTGTRVKMLDKVGFLILAAGVCVVLGHLGIRILTIPIRRNRMNNGKKS